MTQKVSPTTGKPIDPETGIEIRRPQNAPPTVARVADREEIFADLRRYDRTPFLRILADIMGCPPSIEALKLFANDHPDKWAFAIATMARIGGFTEKTEVVGNVHHHIHLMSDAELRQRIESLERERSNLDEARIVEHLPIRELDPA